MIVAIDIGNTRLKWGVRDAGAWLDWGALPTADVVSLEDVARNWPAQGRIIACNVAGAAVEKAFTQALGEQAARLHWLRSGAQACGVRNGYEQPEKLGADRWAALIGARGRVSADCLVVCAGTATTVDRLDADGLFRGGLILPGSDLMRSALAQNTAQLPLVSGHYRELPCNTADAIVSGCLQAQLGAIERMYAALADVPGAVCLMTGGAAQSLAGRLNIPSRLVENLVLEGLVRFMTSQ